MKNKPTYRLASALFLAGLVLQVFILQGLHHVIGHHHHDEPVCDLERPHIHSEGHGHFSCDLCLFHFAPSDFQVIGLSVQVPEAVLTASLFAYQGRHFTQTLRQSCLRGPPSTGA